MKTTTPAAFNGYSMTPLSLIGIGPKLAVTCGDCLGSFSKRMPLIDHPGLKCPHCGIINIMPLVIIKDEEEVK